MNRRNVLILTAGTPLLACTAGVDNVQWTEEIKLHDGRMIDVSRRAGREHSGFPSYSRGAIVGYGLTYHQYVWSSGWETIPASFDIFDGIPHLVAFIANPALCNGKLPDEYAAVFFKYSNGMWKEVKQKDFPTSEALMNLVEYFWGHSVDDDPKGRWSWDNKSLTGEFNSDHVYTIDSFFQKYSNRLCRRINN